MKRVLLIEDDEDLALITDTLVSDAGFQVDHASSVDEALVRCEAEPPSIALVDVQLPKRSGWDFVEQASRWPGMHVVVYTVHSNEPETIARANRLKVDALVAKSDDPMKLVDIVRRIAHN
jgi:CheY-like chemotaxis protein